MIELIDTKSISRIADWVELNSIYYASNLSKSKLISILEDNGYEEDADSGDALLDSIIAELQRRKQLYGSLAPFEVENNVVVPVRTWEELPEYTMCLLFSYWGAENAHSGTKLFERLSNEVLKSYLNGDAITLGFPTDKPLTVQMNEIAGLLCEERGNRDPSSDDKDRGVDVIGWKSFSDSRNGQVIVLMQCAAGRNWKLKKQIPLNGWCQYIHWNHSLTLPSLSITEVIDKKRWQNRVDDYGLIFDRARIYQSIYSGSYSINQPLRDEIAQWCRERFN